MNRLYSDSFEPRGNKNAGILTICGDPKVCIEFYGPVIENRAGNLY